MYLFLQYAMLRLLWRWRNERVFFDEIFCKRNQSIGSDGDFVILQKDNFA